jgi:hypothetical protein
MITGGFGYTYDIESGLLRRWFIDKSGVKRWVHNKKAVNHIPDSGKKEAVK